MDKKNLYDTSKDGFYIDNDIIHNLICYFQNLSNNNNNENENSNDIETCYI